MKKTLLILLISFFNLSFLFSQVAVLEGFKGSFEIVRNAQVLTIKDPKFLFQDLDIILAGDDPITLSFNRLTGIKGTLQLNPRSAVLLVISSLKEEQMAQIFNLNGQIEVALEELVGRSQLLVRNSNLITFLPPQGKVVFVSLTARDALVMPLSGQLRVQQVKGTPNVVITQGIVGELLDNKFNTRPVSQNTLSGYPVAWLTINRQGSASERLMRLVLTQQAMFARSMGRLKTHGEIWNRWEEEEKTFRMASPSQLSDEISRVQGSLISTYPYVVPLLEVLFALESLPPLAEDKYTQKISADWTAGEFTKQLPSFSFRLKQDIWRYLYWLKIYKNRNKGDFFEGDLTRGV